jgi:nucleotide-binding universal stress UspA family protein
MKLLVAVDLSESTERVVTKAEELAKGLSAKVWLLHVAEPEPDFVGLGMGPQTVRDATARDLHGEHRQIQAIAEGLRQAGVATTALLVQGATAQTILTEASRLDVDMIVMGSHGRGAMVRLLVGSVSEAVLYGSARPVLVVPTHQRT